MSVYVALYDIIEPGCPSHSTPAHWHETSVCDGRTVETAPNIEPPVLASRERPKGKEHKEETADSLSADKSPEWVCLLHCKTQEAQITEAHLL